MLLKTAEKNAVLAQMAIILDRHRQRLLDANQDDLDSLDRDSDHRDQALRDRLVVDNEKIDAMIESVRHVAAQPDPIGQVLDDRILDNGLRIVNRTVPFGTILIIYESRPDVTVEAACIAFKAGSRILLKGGREAKQSNQVLCSAWREALEHCGLDADWIRLLTLNRDQTAELLANPSEQIDLIVPRGGDTLINLVKNHATCPVLVSGRGNNFLFVDRTANWAMAMSLILNGKLQKVSACNALDKVLLSSELPELQQRLGELIQTLHAAGVQVWVAPPAQAYLKVSSSTYHPLDNPARWKEEFLDYQILIDVVPSIDDAVQIINRDSGGHSATIVTEDAGNAEVFMEEVDGAAVYHNASTRFTDGGQMGLGAELAISTEKLHHRGPLGLKQLVSNKYYIYGTGQTRS